jgi:molybdopterin-guanine dinucleotide biosynthesis protein A
MASSDIFGLVLSGGKSTRMGKDKGMIVYHGKPQREYLFDLLQKCCKEVYTSCLADHKVSENFNPLIDQYTFESPINGILTAFKNFPDKAWLVVAVDMPNVNDKVLDALLINRNQNKIATCFYNPDTKLPEPLLTLWEPAAYTLLLGFVKQGKVSPRDFLNMNVVNVIQPPDESIFLNINNPRELPR